MKFSIKDSSVNVTKSAIFGLIYWRNPYSKTSTFVQWPQSSHIFLPGSPYSLRSDWIDYCCIVWKQENEENTGTSPPSPTRNHLTLKYYSYGKLLLSLINVHEKKKCLARVQWRQFHLRNRNCIFDLGCSPF